MLSQTPHPADGPLTPTLSVAVFCGSRLGNSPAYRDACDALGRGLARAGMRLIYGGGQIGLMGVVADAVLAEGGSVLGVIPAFLQRREVAHKGVLDLIVTDSMHDRKHRMFEAADAFITMPGGLGTFDETIEITTWRQLGLHDKPILICDIDGWARPYLAMLDETIARGFATSDTARLYETFPDVSTILAHLRTLPHSTSGQASHF